MRSFFVKFLFGLISGIFTGYIFLNTYEVIANKDIPVAHAIRKIQTQEVINKEIKEFSIKQDSRNLNDNARFEEPDYLEIPALGVRVYLEEARKINGLWYQRPSLGHYIGLNKDDFGNTIDYLIYTDKSWRTIPFADEMEEGTQVRLSNRKGFSVTFEIGERQMLPLDRSFIVDKAENRQIILIIEDSEAQKYYGYSLIVKR